MTEKVVYLTPPGNRKALPPLLPEPADLMRMPEGTTAIYRIGDTDPNYFMRRMANYASQRGAKIVQKKAHLIQYRESETSYCITVTIVKSGRPKYQRREQ